MFNILYSYWQGLILGTSLHNDTPLSGITGFADLYLRLHRSPPHCLKRHTQRSVYFFVMCFGKSAKKYPDFNPYTYQTPRPVPRDRVVAATYSTAGLSRTQNRSWSWSEEGSVYKSPSVNCTQTRDWISCPFDNPTLCCSRTGTWAIQEPYSQSLTCK